MKDQYRQHAVDVLVWYLRSGFSFDEIGNDGRAGSCGPKSSLIYSIGGIYTTTPEKPAKNIVISQLVGKKKLATFALADLKNEVLSMV